MTIFTRFLFSILFFGFFSALSAQTLTISYQNPDALFVCGSDQMSITVQNTGPTATNVQAKVKLPNGVRYVSGTVTGATPQNLANLNFPEFKLTDITNGASVTFNFQVEATCELIEQINSGVQFSTDINMVFNGGATQVTTAKFIIETGYLVFSNITPTFLSGEYGQVLTRTVTIKNTRLGAIGAIRFTDEHLPGYDISAVGLNGNNSTTFFEVDVPGSYFTAFGDGDNLFEKDEEITITEKILITDCGKPAITIPSVIRVSWGCTADPECQIIVDDAQILVTASTLNPLIVLNTKYRDPHEICPENGELQEVWVVNYGTLAATNVTIEPFVRDTGFIAIDPNSFEYNDGSGWMPLDTASGVPTEFLGCGPTPYLLEAGTILPTIEPNDSILVRFRTYVCLSECTSKSPRLRVRYRYPKKCPEDEVVKGTAFLAIDPEAEVRNIVEYNISECLNDSETYNFKYKIKTSRLKDAGSGYVQVVLSIPFGLNWDPSCIPIFDGKSPIKVEITPNPPYNIVRLVYQLPFTKDSVEGDFCLKYVCDANMPCIDSIPNMPPRGTTYTAFPPGTLCDGCNLFLSYQTIFGPDPDQPFACSIAACDFAPISVNNTCGAGGGGGGGGGGGIPGLALASVDSYRINYGLQDDNDDRKADSNQPATVSKIRLDRFMPSDTIRTELKAVVIQGNLSQANLRVFHEVWSSDFGADDGDEFFIPLGQGGFVNYDLLQFVQSSVTVIKATGQKYTCPIEKPTFQTDQHIYTIAVPNVNPPAIVDVVLNMFDEYSIDLAALAATPGCAIPAGTTLGVGDSLVFTADSRFKQNFVPLIASSQPALINFRNTICGTDNVYAWKLTGCFEPKRRQYTGYQEKAQLPIYEVSPCDTTKARDPFIYSMRLARPNLFPFEVRPLTKMLTYSQSHPNIVPHISSQVNFLKLQESVDLLGPTPLTVTIAGGRGRMNLSPIYQQPIDEGYNFEISSRFGKACAYNGVSVQLTEFSLLYPNPCFRSPILDTFQISDPKGITSGSAELALIPSEIVIDLLSEDLDYEFKIRNNSNDFASNGWIFIDSDNKLTNLQLFAITPTGEVAVPNVNGFFQLGDLDPFQIIDFRLLANSQICEDLQVTLRYGWDCDPVTSLTNNACGSYTRVITFKPISPELELDVLIQPDNIPFCQPSGFIEFEIYNADRGVASNTLASVKLPPGLQIVPGSSGISYPSGSAYTPMADPTAAPGNVWEWDPEAASAQLAQSGLLGIDDEPKNAFKIRFKVQPVCGFVANTQITYGADAIRPCGSSSNQLRKPGDPILLNGLTPSSTAIANLSFTMPPGNVDCAGSTELTAVITLGDAPQAGDSIYILLPIGTSYEPNSYTAVLNAPTGPPQVFGKQIQLPLPPTAGAGTTVSFRFKVKYDEPAGCIDRIVTMQTREKESAFCPATNTNCDVYIATSEVFLTLNAQNPQLRILDFNADQASGGSVTFSANVENIGNGQASTPTVQFYADLNGNGQVDATDQLLTTVNATGNIPAGGILPIGGTMNLSPADLCRLLAFVPAKENCACADATYPLEGKSSISYPIGKCSKVPVDIGIPTEAGHTYTWLPSTGLSCVNCSNTTFTPGANINPGELVTIILEDKTDNCTVLHRFEIQFGLTNFNVADQTICAGETVSLEAPPGGTYVWKWNNTNESTAQTLTDVPTATTIYRVTVTFADGCTGIADSKVNVLPNKQTTEPKRLTCKGNPVNILGMLTDVPGVYTVNFLAFNGCDSTVTQELEVIPTEVNITRPLCPGDSVIVNGEVFKEAGQSCKDSIGSNNCEIKVCVNIVEVNNPELPAKDPTIIIQGSTAVLDVPDGLALYDWTPGDWLSCTNCQDPIVTPMVPSDSVDDVLTRKYGLFVRDGNGCTDTVSYRVFVFPPCDPTRLKIPNAFTPDGDGKNDRFSLLEFEGLETVVSLTVYNRWGNKVWDGNGLTDGWDGTTDGNPAPTDVYVWILEVACGEENQKIKGDITLVR
jgi:gliding motility-associated-like protein